MRRKYLLITCLLLLVFGVAATAQGLEAARPDSTRLRPSTLSKDTLLIGDQVIWTLSIKAEEGAGLMFAVELPPTFAEKVELLEAKIDTLKNKKSKEWELSSRLRITSFDSGSYVLPSLPLYLLHASGKVDTVWFGGPKLEVTTIPIDTTTYKPFDIKGPMNYPITVKELLPWGALLLGLLLIAWLIYRWVRHRRENRPLFGKPKPKEPAYLVAFRQLEEIKAQKLWQGGKVKVYYTGVTDVLRIYVTARWGIQAMEQTSRELLTSLKQQSLDKEMLEELSSLLNLADLVKFAKYEPLTEENENAIPKAVRFVQSTMIEEAEAAETENNVSENKPENKPEA